MKVVHHRDVDYVMSQQIGCRGLISKFMKNIAHSASLILMQLIKPRPKFFPIFEEQQDYTVDKYSTPYKVENVYTKIRKEIGYQRRKKGRNFPCSSLSPPENSFSSSIIAREFKVLP